MPLARASTILRKHIFASKAKPFAPFLLSILPVLLTCTPQKALATDTNNTGTITSQVTLSNGDTLENNGTITVSIPNGQAVEVNVTSPSGAVTIMNTGTITDTDIPSYGIHIGGSGLTTITNSLGALISGTTAGIYTVANSGDGNNVYNYGTITSTAPGNYSAAIASFGGNFSSIVNYSTGQILGPSGGDASNAGILNYSGTTIQSLTNDGTINGTVYDVINGGPLTTFNNAQGAGNSSGAIKYAGALPSNYNIIVHSLTSFGRLIYDPASPWNSPGTMTFGIYSGSVAGVAASVLTTGTYTQVLQGILPSYLLGLNGSNQLTGVYSGMSWTLELENGQTSIWDLVVGPSGPDATNTLAALTANGYQVRDALTQRAAAITNAMDYDCRDFSAQNMCMSFQARYTGFDSMSDGAGVLTAAYRLDPNVRIGAFIDQRAVQGKKTGIDYSGDMPTVGAFLGYTQHPDGTGLQGKLALAGNTGKITATRDASLANTEAGSGKSNLNSWAVGGEVGWGMILGNKVLTTPYLGMRYTDVTRAAYTENTTSDVTSPLSYAGYYQRQTTVTAGVRFAGLLTDVIGYQIGIGGDYDVGRSANHYSGTSAISGLETFSVNTNTTTNRVRANAAAGLSYAIDKTQKLTTSISVRQQAYSAQPSVTAMAGYQISF